MDTRVLVAYETKAGATGEIAEAIATTLRDDGLAVDLVPAHEVRSVESYQAVVLGSAVYMGRWRRPAMRLLRRHRRELADRAVWLFCSGPVGEQKEDDPEAERWTKPKKVRALADEIGARDLAVFGGKISEDGGMMARGMLDSTPEELRDLRDWDEIAEWAHGVAAALRAA